MRIRSASGADSGPGLSRIVAGMPCRPMSCTSPARRTVVDVRGRADHASAAARAARSATPREWPAREGERRSVKSATASSAASSSASVRRRCRTGSSRDEGVPVGFVDGLAEHVGGDAAERVDDARDRSACRAGPARRRPRRRLLPVRWKHLDDVGEVEQPHRQRDVLAADAAGHALAVPSRERLLQRRRTRRSPSPSRSAIRAVVRQCDSRPRSTALAAGDHEARAAAAAGAAPGCPRRRGGA